MEDVGQYEILVGDALQSTAIADNKFNLISNMDSYSIAKTFTNVKFPIL